MNRAFCRHGWDCASNQIRNYKRPRKIAGAKRNACHFLQLSPALSIRCTAEQRWQCVSGVELDSIGTTSSQSGHRRGWQQPHRGSPIVPGWPEGSTHPYAWFATSTTFFRLSDVRIIRSSRLPHCAGIGMAAAWFDRPIALPWCPLRKPQVSWLSRLITVDCPETPVVLGKSNIGWGMGGTYSHKISSDKQPDPNEIRTLDFCVASCLLTSTVRAQPTVGISCDHHHHHRRRRHHHHNHHQDLAKELMTREPVATERDVSTVDRSRRRSVQTPASVQEARTRQANKRALNQVRRAISRTLSLYNIFDTCINNTERCYSRCWATGELTALQLPNRWGSARFVLLPSHGKAIA